VSEGSVAVHTLGSGNTRKICSITPDRAKIETAPPGPTRNVRVLNSAAPLGGTTCLGYNRSLEEFARETPLTVPSPQQVIDRTLNFREYVGDYQRPLFVLEQLDMLGEEVVRVLRKEFNRLRPAHVPEAPRTPLTKPRLSMPHWSPPR
jgi:hypothetical protein